MKVIDILIMRSKNENMPKEIIVKGKTRHYKFKKENDINYIDNEGSYLFSGNYLFSRKYNWFDMLDYDVEIVEEPKEELEEIEFAKAGDETIIIINKLIENQNKIIRELKDKK